MRNYFLNATLILLTLLSSVAHSASLSSSNFGSGLTLSGGSTALSSGTIRFGYFPDGFDFAANSGDFAALDAAFIEVVNYSGAISALDTAGFFELALTYATSGSFEGRPFDSTSGSTSDTSSTDLVGEKVYVWVLNNTIPSSANQQAIFSSNSRWMDADEIDSTTRVSIDNNDSGLIGHLGQISTGADIGAGANSHVLQPSSSLPVSNVVAIRTPSAASVLVGSTVTFSFTAEGTAPFTQVWRKNGAALVPAQTGSTLTISAAAISDAGSYDVVVSNGSSNSTSNAVILNVISALPAFEEQPDPVAVKVGGNIEFSVIAKGKEPLSYKWFRGTTALANTNSANLTISNAKLTDSALYRCEVSNTIGTTVNRVLSSQVLATVVQDNVPEARVVVSESATGSTTLTAVYSETGALAASKATLQWQKDGVDIQGAVAKTLRISPLVSSATPSLYTCLVRPAGVALPVTAATTRVVVVNAPPIILDQPGATAALNFLPNQNRVVSQFFTYQIPVDADPRKTPTSFAATNIPTGLKLDPKTGILSGKPTTAKTYDMKITVGNLRAPADVTNLKIIVDGTLAASAAGSYIGSIERGTITGGNLGGRMSLTLLSTGSFSGSVFFGASTLPFAGGSLDIDPAAVSSSSIITASVNVPRPKATPLTLRFNIDGSLLANATLSEDSKFQAITGWKRVWAASPLASRATAYMDSYSFGMSLAGIEPSAPQGSGFGGFTVSANGDLTFSGKTADGENLLGTTFVGPTGQVLIFQTLYTTVQKGSLHGLFNIDRVRPNKNLEGNLTWSRPSNPSLTHQTYRDGFGQTIPVELVMVGGRYVAPVSPTLIFNSTVGANFAATFIGGGVSLADRNPNVIAELRTGNLMVVTTSPNTAKTAFKVVPATGIISGSFELRDENPVTTLVNADELTRAVPFQGRIIRDEFDSLVGVGYYLLPQIPTSSAKPPILSGEVIIEQD